MLTKVIIIKTCFCQVNKKLKTFSVLRVNYAALVLDGEVVLYLYLELRADIPLLISEQLIRQKIMPCVKPVTFLRVVSVKYCKGCFVFETFCRLFVWLLT
jgi:hypothetical protein